MEIFRIVRRKGIAKGVATEEVDDQGALWRALADTKEENEETE